MTTKRPTPPPPYRGNSPLMEKKKKSLTKAKSMEDIIAFFSSPKTDNPQKFSPELKHRKITTNSSPHTPAHLGQHETSPNFDVTNGPTVSRNRSETAPEQPSITSSPPYHSRLSHPLERSTSPPSAIVGTHGKEKQNVSPHHPLQTATSSSDSEPMLPKTYVAMCSYTSQSEGCLSFSAGDKCVLIQQNIEGWWLVNIGGREGWTPGEYWKESLVSSLVPVLACAQYSMVIQEICVSYVITEQDAYNTEHVYNTEQHICNTEHVYNTEQHVCNTEQHVYNTEHVYNSEQHRTYRTQNV